MLNIQTIHIFRIIIVVSIYLVSSCSGAQAAAYANKTPSPAGAGFDHQSAGAASQPSNVDQLQAWASQTVQK